MKNSHVKTTKTGNKKYIDQTSVAYRRAVVKRAIKELKEIKRLTELTPKNHEA